MLPAIFRYVHDRPLLFFLVERLQDKRDTESFSGGTVVDQNESTSLNPLASISTLIEAFSVWIEKENETVKQQQQKKTVSTHLVTLFGLSKGTRIPVTRESS